MLTQGHVSIVGAGPGSPDLLTIRAHRAITEADIVLHDLLIPDELLELIPERRRECVGKRGYGPRVPQEFTMRRMVELAQKGLHVVRLKCGDPFVFGRGGEEGHYLADHGVPFDIVPGLSSAIAAAASAGVPLTHRGVSRHFSVVTGHTLSGEDRTLARALLTEGGTVVVLMGARGSSRLVDDFISDGIDPDLGVAIVSRATHADESIRFTTLRAFRSSAEAEAIPRPATLIFGRSVDHRVSCDVLSGHGTRALGGSLSLEAQRT